NLHVSVPLWLIALIIRRGDFALHQDCASLLNGTEHEIMFRDRELPVFRVATAKGVSRTEFPMSARMSRDFLKGTSRKAGLEGAVPYNFRIEVATATIKRHGLDATRKALTHTAGSKSVQTHYNDGNHHLDFTGTTTRKADAGNMMLERTAGITRGPGGIAPRMPLEILLKISPEYGLYVKCYADFVTFRDSGDDSETWCELLVREILVVRVVRAIDSRATPHKPQDAGPGRPTNNTSR
ncbi:hypothetical protein C8F01DRAFT_1000474, partial [Mycena amicta]